MTSSWKYLLAGLAMFGCLSVVYLHANVQTPAPMQPLITEALIDVERAALTINGYNFPTSVPNVTLGMTELTAVSATESAVLAELPQLLPGTYLLGATWPEGVAAVFFLTVGAAGPVGPPGPTGFLQGSASTFESPGSGLSSVLTRGEHATAGADSAAAHQSDAHITNTHLGEGALEDVTTGHSNTAIGHRTLRSLTTGDYNAGLGRSTLGALTTGSANLAIGSASMLDATTASSNVAIGYHTLRFTVAGENNVAIGAGSLLANLSDKNVGIGRNALRRNTDGSDNIAIGYEAGKNSVSGSNNIYIGNAGARGEEGTIRIGTEGVHNRIYLSGEIVGGGVGAVYQ